MNESDREAPYRRLLIVGASGFVGANIASAESGRGAVVLHSASHSFDLVGRSIRADLMIEGSADALVLAVAPDLVVNCAALADVDRCEALPEVAIRLNVEVPGELARASARAGARFVHLSTDAVFGSAEGPHLESSPVDPVNHYGRTKAAGEERVLAEMPSALVVRTCPVGWSPSGRRSLLEYFVTRFEAGQAAPGFADILFRPVSPSQLWQAVLAWLAEGATGVRHATGSELLSKFDFGRRVASAFGFDSDLVERSSAAAARLTARRPGSLDVVPSVLPPGAVGGFGLDPALTGLRELSEVGYRERLRAFVRADVEAS